MQKVAFDDEVDAPFITKDPPRRTVLAWRNSPDSMRTHELLLRYEIARDRQISRSLVRLLQLQAQELQVAERVAKASARLIAPPPPARKPPASQPQREHGERRSDEAIPTKRTRQPIETTIRQTPSSPSSAKTRISLGTQQRKGKSTL
jgi:hypothetical protein